MPITIAFRSSVTTADLPRIDSRIKALIFEAAAYLARQNCPLTITCLLRDRAVQESIYRKAVSIGAKEPVRSPHEDGRAVDISIRGLSDEIVSGLVDHLNTAFPYEGNPKFKTALRHDVGQGDHVHIQVAPTGNHWGMNS